MPRFVILEHDHPELHWDLMLESAGTLKTWRLARPPEHPGDAIPATPLGDHRIAYLDYEGPVSGDRGTVTRWDAGTYEAEGESLFPVRLQGSRVQGRMAMEKTAAGWVLIAVTAALGTT